MTDTITLSPREREVLAAVCRTGSVGFNTLAQFFEDRIPVDEIAVIVTRLKRARLIGVYPGQRTQVVITTAEGRRLAKVLRLA